MGMLLVHREALESSNVAYNDFLLLFRRNERIVYGFTEGKEDASFYRSFIDSLLPEDWACRLIKAGNKRKVIETFSLLDWSRFPRESICFFVDQDLSAFLPDTLVEASNIYVTNSYSIENEIVSFEALLRTLDEVLCVGTLSLDEIAVLRGIYDSNLATFKSSLTSVMAQIVLWRQAEVNGKGQRACLDNIKLQVLFSFNRGELALTEKYLTPDSRIEYASQCVGVNRSAVGEIAQAERLFLEKDGPDKFIRGKYMLWFFVECAEHMRQSMPILFGKHIVPPGSNPGLGLKNAVMLIGPRARCPRSFRDFITSTFLRHIEVSERQAEAGMASRGQVT